MTTIRKRIKLTTRGGRFQQYNVDELTRVRLQYASARAQQLFGIPCTHSTIVRAAVAAYVRDLDSTAAGLAGLDPESEKYKRALVREQHRLQMANSGGTAPFKELPADAITDQLEPLKDIIKRYANKSLTIK